MENCGCECGCFAEIKNGLGCQGLCRNCAGLDAARDSILKICDTFSDEVPDEEVNYYQQMMTDLVSGRKKRWSLYRSLHNVGDDPVKSAIQDDLQTVLDPETFALVEAIFQWNADDDLATF